MRVRRRPFGIGYRAARHGKREEEIPRWIAATVNVVLSQKKGDVGGVLRTSYMDGDRINLYFGQRRRVGSAEVLKKIAREGVPVKIRTEGDLASEMA